MLAERCVVEFVQQTLLCFQATVVRVEPRRLRLKSHTKKTTTTQSTDRMRDDRLVMN